MRCVVALCLFSLLPLALASVGNTQLRAAYNAAQNELLLDNYAGYKELLPSYLVPGWTRCGDCLAVEGAYPWPKKSEAVGVFANVLESGILRAANPGDLEEEDPDMFNFITRITEIIGDHYGVDLKLELPAGFENSPDCFNALNDGDADLLVPNFSFGAFVGDVPRTEGWQAGCGTSCGVSVILVRADRNTSDVASFAASLQAGEKIGTGGAGSFAEAQALLPTAELVLYDGPEEVLLADFNAGKVVAVYGFDLDFLAGVEFETTQLFTDAFSVAGTFFALDDAPECEGGDKTTDIDTQINFNFNGMIPKL